MSNHKHQLYIQLIPEGMSLLANTIEKRESSISIDEYTNREDRKIPSDVLLDLLHTLPLNIATKILYKAKFTVLTPKKSPLVKKYLNKYYNMILSKPIGQRYNSEDSSTSQRLLFLSDILFSIFGSGIAIYLICHYNGKSLETSCLYAVIATIVVALAEIVTYSGQVTSTK